VIGVICLRRRGRDDSSSLDSRSSKRRANSVTPTVFLQGYQNKIPTQDGPDPHREDGIQLSCRQAEFAILFADGRANYFSYFPTFLSLDMFCHKKLM
jgi:hypothetical protein